MPEAVNGYGRGVASRASHEGRLMRSEASCVVLADTHRGVGEGLRGLLATAFDAVSWWRQEEATGRSQHAFHTSGVFDHEVAGRLIRALRGRQ